jgi:hypothetical protein
MHRERVVRLLLAGALVMTAPGCGEDSGDETGRRTAPTGGWRTAGCEFSRPMERIDRGGRERFATSFAGLEVDQIRVRAIVYRVPSDAFDDFIRANAEDSCIVVRDAAHAMAELTGWHDRVVADLPYWDAQGLRITTVGSRHDGVGVEIGTRDLEATRSGLLARYGDDAPLVFVEEGPVRPLSAG